MQSNSHDAHSNALPEDEIALKQRIQDLKTKLDTIQTEKDESQGYRRFQGKQKWRALVFLIAVTAVCHYAIPVGSPRSFFSCAIRY